ncbi:MAG: hypothetical protein R2682_14420 [Pyrinomonadaceae bacterium]
MSTFLQLATVIAAIFLLLGNSYAQNKFEGYSFTLEADIRGTCPITYLPEYGGKECDRSLYRRHGPASKGAEYLAMRR